MNELTKNQKIFIIIFLLIIVAVLGYTIWNFTKDNSNETEIDDLMINTNTENITNRYGTFTGNTINSLSIADCTQAVLTTLDKEMRKKPKRK